MRNMSFSHTLPQLLDGTKTVTRRMGWQFLKPGDRLRAVEKAQGLKRGEKIVVLGILEVLRVSRVMLGSITKKDVIREGFPRSAPYQFVEMFMRSFPRDQEGQRTILATFVTRIHFKFTKGER